MDARTEPRSGGAPESLGPLIAAFLEQSGLVRPKVQRQLLDAWCQTVGGDLAGHTRVVAFRRNVLEVEVDSAARLHELNNFRRPDLLAKLTALVANPYIRDIRFKPGAF